MEKVNGLAHEPEVFYEDKPLKEDGGEGQLTEENKPLLGQEEKKPFGEKLVIGSFEELEKLIKENGEKKE